MKESHGSVEMNALASAREINDKGVYSVGNLSTSGQSACRKVCCEVILSVGHSVARLVSQYYYYVKICQPYIAFNFLALKVLFLYISHY